MPTLTIQLPGHPPVEHVLREEIITLGRSLANRIALDYSSVSQSHATITRIGGDYFLQDLQSTNGTLLNGQSIREAQLHDRDILKLGEVAAIFEMRSTAAPVATLAVLAASSAATPSARPAKSDTAVLSVKAKTSLLKSVSPGANVIPPTPAPQGSGPITLAAALLGSVLLAGVVGFLAWMLVGSHAAKLPVVALLPLNVQATPQASPVAEVAEPLAAADPVMPSETPAIAEETNTIAEPETNNLPELLAALKSSDVMQRRCAAEAINGLGSTATNALLNLRLALLQDSDPEVRMWLGFTLVDNQTYDQAAISALVEAMSHERAALRKRACGALALIPLTESGKATAMAALQTATTDESAEVREEALASLRLITPEVAK